MIWHQAIGMDLPIGFSARFGQSLQEILPIHVINEYILLAITSIHHVVNCARIFHSHRPWHESQNAPPSQIVKHCKNQSQRSRAWQIYGLTPDVGIVPHKIGWLPSAPCCG